MKNDSKYKPCKICEEKGKLGRFHPEDKCWFKGKEKEKNNEKKIKYVNNSEVEVDLNDDQQNQKNL